MCIRLNRLTSPTAAIFAVMVLSLCWATVSLCQVPPGPAMRPFRMPDGVKILRDVEYARVGDKSLLLDIYMPEKTTGPLPLIVWVHGGAWQVGSKNGCPAMRLVPQGYIAASINYRLSQEAPFPAQIEDCKGAIRFLRAGASKYSIDPNRVGVWGSSAGGHLVALLGTTGDNKELEGNVGGNLDQSSRVQAVVDFFGPADLGKMLNRFGPATSADANGPVIRLLGPDLKSAREMAPKASPVTYARKDNAPFLIVHGDKDPAVPIGQSEALRDALKAAGVDVEMHVLKGAGHGFQGADAETANKYVADFFAKQLKGTATSQPAADATPPAASGPASRPVAVSPAPATRPAEGPDPDRGLYAIWYQNKPSVLDLPFVKGGQVVVQWSQVERANGRCDFTDLDRQLKAFHDAGRKATVQVNANLKPAWLFDKVAVLPEQISVQVKDAKGTLQYWDPVFVEAYRSFLFAYAKHMKESPYRRDCLGIRANYNAIGTEIGVLQPKYRATKAWQAAPDGHVYEKPWTPQTWDDYKRTIFRTFVEAFGPDMRVFVRGEAASEGFLDANDVALVHQGKWGLLRTGAEAEPRRATEKGAEDFLSLCRQGKTLGYSESMADAEGNHGGVKDPRTCSPCQWNYWRLLFDLHSGMTFIAVYGADLARADDPEFRSAFEFAARYAGWHACPEKSPGAWVALREGQYLKGDYTFLMEPLTGKGGKAVAGAGPESQRFGAWARSIDVGTQMALRLDKVFADSLASKPCRLRVVYLDQGTEAIEVSWDAAGKPQSAQLKRAGTGKWVEGVIDVPSAGFGRGLDGADIVLKAGGRAVIHMVEVQRGQPGA